MKKIIIGLALIAGITSCTKTTTHPSTCGQVVSSYSDLGQTHMVVEFQDGHRENITTQGKFSQSVYCK